MRVSKTMNFDRSLACFIVLLAVSSPAFGQGKVAYVGATLETMGREGRLENATLIVDGGRIAAVGVDLEIPDGARRIPMAGKTILPGLIDPYYVFGRREQQQPDLDRFRRRGGFGGRRGGASITQGPFRRVVDSFYPYDTDFKPTLRCGITTANLVRSGYGQSALARMRPDRGTEMIFDPDGLLFAAVTNDTGALDTIREGLDPSRASRSGSRGRGRGDFGGRRGGFGRGGGRRGGGGEETEVAAQALWKSVRDGEQLLVLNANNAAAVLHTVKVLQPYEKVKVALVASGPNLYELLDEARENEVTLILQPTIDRVPYTTDWMSVPGMAHEQGVPFVFSMSLSRSQMEASQDDPLFALASLVKAGLPREVALKAVTLGPAELLGLDETHGSLEAKKLANLLIFDGDPLTTGSRLESVVVEGKVVHEG